MMVRALFATRSQDFITIRIKYDLDCAKWDQSNYKCLMIIKNSIMEVIRGAILSCETAKEYLKKVESQFTGSSNVYASSLIKRFIIEKYQWHWSKRAHPEDEQQGFQT
jgi:hypothetical protein